MSVKELVEKAQELTLEERKELIKALVDMLGISQNQPKKRLRDFKGIGAKLYDGVDAQDYVNQLRAEWDSE